MELENRNNILKFQWMFSAGLVLPALKEFTKGRRHNKGLLKRMFD